MSTIPKHPNSVESATSTRLARPSPGLWRTRKSLTMSALSSPFFVFFTHFLSLFFFFEHTTAFTPKSGLPGPFFDRCFDDLGSLIIFRSTSVRPKHLFDPYFEP